MKSLLKYLKNYKKESFCAPLFKMLEACFDLIVPLVVSAIIDNGIKTNDTSYVLKMGGVLVLLAFVGLAFSITAQYFAAKASAGFGQELRHELFSHIQKLSYTNVDKYGASTFITRMTADANLVQSQVNMALRLLLRSPFIVFGAMIMAFFVDFKTALVFAVSIPVLSVIVYGIMLITIPLYKKVQGALDKVMGSTRKNLSGTRVIRAFNKEDEEIDRYNSENELLNKFQIFAGKISTIMNPMTYIVINVAIIAILWIGGERVDTGILTQGKVVALVNYMSQVLVELVKLASLIINLTKAFASAKRIQDIFDIPCNIEQGTLKQGSDKENIVEFDNVSLTYELSKEPSIEGVNLKVKKGQTIGIIGGTGSGKTTLVNLIPRFYEVSDGKISVDGQDIRNIKLNSLRKNIGMVQQDVYLFAGTIFDNIKYGRPDATKEEVIEAAKEANAYDFIMSLPKGFDTDIGQRGIKLSGGQKQRLSIARVFLKNPPILIFDEATSALDNESEKIVQKSMEKLAKNRTTLVIAHRLSTIRNAKKILVLTENGIEEQGTHEELMEKQGIYYDLYKLTKL